MKDLDELFKELYPNNKENNKKNLNEEKNNLDDDSLYKEDKKELNKSNNLPKEDLEESEKSSELPKKDNNKKIFFANREKIISILTNISRNSEEFKKSLNNPIIFNQVERLLELGFSEEQMYTPVKIAIQDSKIVDKKNFLSSLYRDLSKHVKNYLEDSKKDIYDILIEKEMIPAKYFSNPGQLANLINSKNSNYQWQKNDFLVLSNKKDKKFTIDNKKFALKYAKKQTYNGRYK